MKYISTRGQTAAMSFKEAVMMGLAPDGGLLVPERIPNVESSLREWRDLSYPKLALAIITRFVDDISESDLSALIDKSYATFSHDLVTPLKFVDGIHLLELFHGPTLAFKDIALQLLGNLFDFILRERGEKLNILGATSGDTGSAAIAGVRGLANIKIFIMFPDGRISAIQEQQMTSVLDDNVHNLAVDGSFDDCQALLKEVFADLSFRDQFRLGAVNSVNWARVLAQVVYYFSSWYQLGMPRSFDVCVPTGNFGNIFAGYVAKRMGLPISNLVLATNSNDILSQFFNQGQYRRGEVVFTHSPAMDIQVASNFERYLFFRFGQQAAKVCEFMDEFKRLGHAAVHVNTAHVDPLFRAGRVDDAQTIECIADFYAKNGYLLDPHTAVAVDMARRHQDPAKPMVCMATAHPAKFPEVMGIALPKVRAEHPSLLSIQGLPTRKKQVAADPELIMQTIRDAQ